MVLSFQPTYEELKPLSSYIENHTSSLFSAYLRGIETLLCIRLSIAAKMFSAYLRGIETYDSEFPHHSFGSFQPTYEELKLRFRFHIVRNHLSFQPTYEELKQESMVESNRPKNSFQPTYEELKLNCVQFHGIWFQSFQPTYEELKHRSGESN